MYFFKSLLALGLAALGASSPVSNATLDVRIIRGDYVTGENFGAPWFCGIFRVNQDNEQEYVCGSTLIAMQTVLTSAECFKDGESYVARCGTNSLLGGPFAAIPIDTYRRHYGYGKTAGDTITNNIAMGYFKDPIECSDRVQLIELQTDPVSDTVVNLEVYGFGRDNFPTGSNGDNEPTWALKSVDSTRYDPKKCTSYFKNLLYYPQVPAGTICAATKDPQATQCQLDQGGPLINKETQRLIGIVSYVSPHCSTDRPGVYTLVDPYTTWIGDWVKPLQTFSPRTPGN